MNLEWEVERLVPGTHITGAYFQFKTTDPDFNKRSLGLFFEYDQVGVTIQRVGTSTVPNGGTCESLSYTTYEPNPSIQSPHAVARAQSAWRLPEGDYRWSQDYVLVYVRSLGRLFKRLQSNSKAVPRG